MENLEQEIKSIEYNEIIISIEYENNNIEIVEKNKDGYRKLYDAWLKEQPMFISDIYKTQMRDLTFASRGNENALNDLNTFLSENNKEQATEFIIYMRKRDLTYEKSKWTKK